MLIRIARLFTASLVVSLAFPVRDASAAARTSATPPRSQGARVVLIGVARSSEGLRAVLSELLEREGVTVEYEARAHFSSHALLSESVDARVWVFVSETGPHAVKLYFRGPSGKRFLLRQLALKNGLDELGRELIGQVVETSTLALLRSDAGVSREEARAGISSEQDDTDALDRPGPEPSAVPSEPEGPASEHDDAKLELELDARGVVKWAGPELGFDHGIGVEAALALRRRKGLFLRGRVNFEDAFGQSFEAGGLDVDVRTLSLRAGLDVGTTSGASTFSLGVLAGADFTRTLPRVTTDPTLTLGDESHAAVPMIRLEARYELGVGAFFASGSLFGDLSLASTHYDVGDAAGDQRVAAPWPVRPGAALTLGLRTNL